MPKRSFLLVSLREDKAKELAQIISNDSCRKVLDYLADREDATESELAEKLGIPISTVHYNIWHLVRGGLVIVEEFHYSEKGKEVNHYKLANKYIIIAPKSTYGIKEKLKGILPVCLLALAGAGFIQIYNTMYFRGDSFGAMKTAAPAMMEQAAADAAPLAESVIGKGAEEGARAVVERAPEAAANLVSAAPNYALWFLSGCLFVIILVVLFELIRARKEKNR